LKKLLLVATAFILPACASAAPPPVTTDVRHAYQAPFDAVWEATVQVFAEHNIPIENIEKDSGIISTDWALVQKDDSDCGGTGMFYHRDRQGQFNVFIHEVGNRAIEVQVNTQFRVSVYDLNGRYTGLKTCSSTGTIESAIQDGINARIETS